MTSTVPYARFYLRGFWLVYEIGTVPVHLCSLQKSQAARWLHVLTAAACSPLAPRLLPINRFSRAGAGPVFL